MNQVTRSISERIFAGMRRSGGSLRAQLIFWNVVALSLLVGGLGVACRFATFSVMLQSVDRELERSVDMYLRPPRARLFHQGQDGPPPGPPPFDDSGRPPELERRGDKGHAASSGRHEGHHGPPHTFDAANEYRAHHYNANGQSEITTDTRPTWDAGALAAALRGETVKTTVVVNEEPLRVLSAPAFNIQGKKGAVQIAYPLKEVYRAVSGIDTSLLLLLPIGLLGVMWLGSSLTNRVLRRVHLMTQAAGEIGTGDKTEDFSRRLPVSGSDEFSALAETFNGLLGRLDTAFQEQQQLLHLQQRFTADASHELKTPLTIIKGRAGLALSRDSTDERSRRTFREIDEATDRMAHLVQDLLLLARSDEGRMGSDPVELGVEQVLEAAIAQSLQEGSAPIALNILPDTPRIRGNEAELTRLFRNLLDNAIRYTPPEGYINIGTRGARDGAAQNVIITVEDTGAGIALEHLPHLGERFYRVDTSRTRPTGGTGLGLSICRGVVAAHGGTLQFSSAPGLGTTVTVTLPSAPTSQ